MKLALRLVLAYLVASLCMAVLAVVLRPLHAHVPVATVLHAPSRAELTELFVLPRWWRAGIGRQLLVAAERSAAAQGAEALYVVANERARRFYEAAGYEVLGAVMTDFGEAPEMRRWL